MSGFIHMFTVSSAWRSKISGIQKSSMILECNFTVFICEISGNDLRSLIEFRVKIRFSDTMTKMDRRDDKQIKVLSS